MIWPTALTLTQDFYEMKWICSQIGAREHYAVPRVLHRAGKLECLYTDLWAGTMWQAMGSFLGRPIVLGGRHHKDLSDARVESFDVTTLVDSVFGGDLKKNPYNWFLYVGRDFGESVVESFRRKKGVNWKETTFFGYDTGFLEPAEWVKARGGKSIVCQMDPSRFEVDLVKEEEKLWPGWAKRLSTVPEAYFQRREEEWEVADLVMVNSEWSKRALIQQGVPEHKLVVVPLAYEAPKVEGRESSLPEETRQTAEGSPKGRHGFVGARCRQTRDEGSWNAFNSSTLQPFNEQNPMRVLFLGQVILRKGIQYLIETAKMMQAEEVQFDIVGPIGISEEAVKSAPPNMNFHGPISRDRAPEFFGNANLFVLPTLSDGFALTQLEAMAYGLPVIATPNCGEVVSNGVDGMIVPTRDAAALAEAIRSLIQDSEKLQGMRLATRAKVSQFSLSVLGENLRGIEQVLAIR